jgi:hypothetical protein
MALKDCKEFIVMDNHNIYYTNEKGEKVFDAQKKDTVVNVDVTQAFSDNLKEVIQSLYKPKKRTFWEYLKSDILSNSIITIFSITMAIISYYEGVMFMTYFMSGVFLTALIASLIDWKTKG